MWDSTEPGISRAAGLGSGQGQQFEFVRLIEAGDEVIVT